MNRFLLLFALIALIACNANKPLGTKTKEPLSEYQLKKLTSELMDAEDFKKAEALLVDADSLVSLDPDLSFRLGICQFRQNRHSDANKSFARTIANNQTDLVPIDAYFYRGLSCYFNNDIDSSLFFYQFLKDTLTKLNDKKFLKIVDTEIIRCQTLDSLRKDSVIWEVTELDSISSPYSDHSPVVNGDESVMIFTSKRAGKKVPNTDGFYEDIYITSKVDNQWITPESISDSINTPLHEASIGLSADGQKLFIYKSEDRGSIYYSELKGDVWTKPKKFGSPINSSSRETHASMSADGQQIYFTSDRPGGLGGMDIWVTNLLPDGSWGEAKNLGPAINTEFDEEGPFIHPDNISLYFSSKGHNSIGGYDIFSAEKNEFGTWRLAKNLGYPVNTIYDNLFFQMSANGKRAYYASQSESSGGNTNLFMCVFPNAEEKPLTIMIGHVTVPCGELPFVSITVNDLVSNKIVGIFAPNSKTGKFIFFLNRGKDYQISVEANDQEVLLDTIHVNADAKFEEIYKNIVLEPIEPCSKTVVEVREDVKEHKIIAKKLKFPGDDIEYDEAIEIKNILFPVGENEFRGPNRSTDALAEYLKHNPTAVVEIGGHTDSSGKKPNNDRLSLKRAKSVKNYLLRKGVNSRQLTTVGYGSSVPIAKDHNDDQSWNEQSMSYNRRIEFKVLTQGKSLLKILQIDNIPADLKVKQIVVVISKDGE